MGKKESQKGDIRATSLIWLSVFERQLGRSVRVTLAKGDRREGMHARYSCSDPGEDAEQEGPAVVRKGH